VYSCSATGKSFTNESINEWQAMLERGVIEEVRAAGAISATASQMIGLREIRELLEGKNVAGAVHRGNSTGDPPLRQKDS
jgi:tRNA A37 N6-isopentenylltransferase MiaA